MKDSFLQIFKPEQAFKFVNEVQLTYFTDEETILFPICMIFWERNTDWKYFQYRALDFRPCSKEVYCYIININKAPISGIQLHTIAACCNSFFQILSFQFTYSGSMVTKAQSLILRCKTTVFTEMECPFPRVPSPCLWRLSCLLLGESFYPMPYHYPKGVLSIKVYARK